MGSALQNQTEQIDNKYYLKYFADESIEGDCVLLKICPIKFSIWKFILFILSNILLFLPWLITFWYPYFQAKFYYDYCCLDEATAFLILNYDLQYSIAQKQEKVFLKGDLSFSYNRYFVNRYMTYIIDQDGSVKATVFDYKNSLKRLIKDKNKINGLSNAMVHQHRKSYGLGTMVIKRPTCGYLTINQILRPLYIFSIYSVLLWTFAEQYYYFASILFITSFIGIVINTYQIIQLNTKIYHMAYYQIEINVLREGKVQSISSLDVVPGDIVFLKKPIKLPFEAILLEGSALINECALTGESVPVVKKADSFYELIDLNHKIDKSAYLFQGTTIIQVNDKKKMVRFESYRESYGVPVFVIKTNFVTTKGQLVRIILFPKEQQNIFQLQSYKFIMFLFSLTITTYIVLLIFIYEYATFWQLLQKFLDLFSVTIPPGLPVSMTFGIIYAVQRLEKKGIFCITQNKVIDGGMVQLCCFDKTGTLTQDFMDFYCLVPASNAQFYPEIKGKQLIDHFKNTSLMNTIMGNMGANHSIIKIESTGELIGDPMEIKMFQFGLFQFSQSFDDSQILFAFESNRDHRGQVFRRFQFDSDLQRMSVICKDSLNGNQLYAKGSPQIMMTLMVPSTVPQNYNSVLRLYASRGFRVLAIGHKSLKGDFRHLQREQAQKDLIFDGFQIFENKLKIETAAAINDLKKANMKCVMITGDNTLTGSNISYSCGMSDLTKQMLICDFRSNKFVEETFIFLSQPHANNSNNIVERSFINDQEYDYYLNELVETAEKKNYEICITGRAFEELFKSTSHQMTDAQSRFMNYCTVFARTKPSNKAKIVLMFQLLGKRVSMCGDGANDCGALKQANIGLSLSMAEASISAPFTSQITNISSMVELIKQCRAGLAVNFSLFNIVAMYCLIQYSNLVICQRFLQYPPDFQQLYWDLVLNFFFVVVIGYTATSDNLCKERPKSSLFSLTNMAQILITFILVVSGQIVTNIVYKSVNSDYYLQYGGFDNDIRNFNNQRDFYTDGIETNIVFLFSNNMYLATVLGFNIDSPWRKRFYTNIPFVIVLFCTLTYNQVLILSDEGTLSLFMVKHLTNNSIRLVIFLLSAAFSCLIFVNIKYILEPLSQKLIDRYPHLKWI